MAPEGFLRRGWRPLLALALGARDHLDHLAALGEFETAALIEQFP